MSSIQLIDPTQIPQWDNLIRIHPAATPFHSSGWARVLRDTYGFTPYYACVFKGEALSTCLPIMEVNSFLTGRRGVSLPFTDFCDPLLNGSVSSGELTDFAMALGRDRHWKYLELRGGEFSVTGEDGSEGRDGRWKMEDGRNCKGSLPNALAPCDSRPCDSRLTNIRGKREDGSNSLASPQGEGRGRREEERGEKTEESKNPTPSQEEGRGEMGDGSNSLASPQGEGRRKMEEGSKDSTPSPGSLSSLLTPDSSPKAPGAPRSAPCPLRSYSHHLLDLTPGPDRLFKGLRESTCRNIRKSEKEGVTVRFTTDLEAVKSYYRLHCLTRKRHGVPPQPFTFFSNLHRYLIASGQGFVALADYQGRTVAGVIFLIFGDQAVFKFGASDNDFHYLRPNNLVMWAAISRVAEDGVRTLSLGRTDMRDKGLIQYKVGWGTREKALIYTRCDIRTSLDLEHFDTSSSIYTKVFQRMPLLALKLLGKAFYKHFGA